MAYGVESVRSQSRPLRHLRPGSKFGCYVPFSRHTGSVSRRVRRQPKMPISRKRQILTIRALVQALSVPIPEG